MYHTAGGIIVTRAYDIRLIRSARNGILHNAMGIGAEDFCLKEYPSLSIPEGLRERDY